jgi:hypothetical protein
VLVEDQDILLLDAPDVLKSLREQSTVLNVHLKGIATHFPDIPKAT